MLSTWSNIIRSGASIPNNLILSSSGAYPIFDMDNAGGSTFWTNGRNYSSASALMTALSATTSGVTAVVGPYIDPAGTNILTNGTFDTDTTGWTAINSATIAIVSGEMQVTGGGVATGGFSQAVSGFGNRAFRVRGTGRKGTTGSALAILGTTQNSVFSSAPATIDITSTSNTTTDMYISTAKGTNTWFGGKANIATSGTSFFDNLSAVEAMPMPGWTTFAGGVSTAAGPTWSVFVDAVAPASISATQVIWQADADTERDRVRLTYGTDNHVHLIVTSNNNGVLDFDLGTVALGARFRVAMGCAQAGGVSDATTGFAASLNGANSQALFQNKDLPGVSKMRIGNNVAGTAAWTGTFNRVSVVPGRQPTEWLEAMTVLPNVDALWTEGDSYMAFTNGYGLTDGLEASIGVPAVNSAVGGSTLAQIATRISARVSYLKGRRLIVWDGSANGHVTGSTATEMALYDQIWQANGGRVLFIPSIQVGPASTNAATVSQQQYIADLASITQQLITKYGAGNVYDPLPYSYSLGDGSAGDNADIAAGIAPRSTLNADGLHESTSTKTGRASDPVLLAKINAL